MSTKDSAEALTNAVNASDKERLAAIGELAKVGWWELRFQDNEVYWSDQVRQIHEVPSDFRPSLGGALGFILSDDRERVVAKIGQAEKEGIKYEVTYRIKTAKGNKRWLRSTGEPTWRAGTIVGMQGVCQDITKEKEAEISSREKEDRLKQAIAFSNIGFFEWCWDTDQVYWDRGACLIMGMDADEVIQKHEEVIRIIHPEDETLRRTEVEKLKELGDFFSIKHRIFRMDGELRWIQVKAEVVRLKEDSLGVLGMILDITESQTKEEMLKLARDEADQANRAKTEFLAIANHELRTPLSTIIGPSELALQATQEPRIRRFLEMTLNSGRYLLELINRVLDLAQIESGELKLKREITRSEPFWAELVKPLAANAQQAGIELEHEIDCPEKILIDRVVFRQVFFNLVGNAIKHCQGTRIHVSLQASPEELLLSVADDGAGIVADERQRIFERFQQGVAKGATKPEGSGLGLAICRRLADLVGGSIDVVSGDGAGAEFYFRMPVSPMKLVEDQSEELDELPDHLSQDSQSGSRILIVEDDETNRVYLEYLVESLGLEFDSVNSGEEAIRKFESEVHRVVLMDIWLTGMPGDEAARVIREKAGESTVYIIAQTASIINNKGQQMKADGFDELVAKPISVPLMVGAIGKGLSRGST